MKILRKKGLKLILFNTKKNNMDFKAQLLYFIEFFDILSYYIIMPEVTFCSKKDVLLKVFLQ